MSAGGGIQCGPEVTGEYNLAYENETLVLEYENHQPHAEAAFTIYLQRDMGPFMNVVIIPCVMLFIVGYSSMYLTAQPARAAFAIICLLTVLRVNDAGTAMTPVHTGSTWADEWLLMHLVFSFIILLENVLSYHPWLQLPKPPKPGTHAAKSADTEMEIIGDPEWAKIIPQYFARYDIDKSGSIELEELAQLTINLISKLELSDDIPLDKMDECIERLEQFGEIHLTVKEFEVWFMDLVKSCEKLKPDTPGQVHAAVLGIEFTKESMCPNWFHEFVDKLAHGSPAWMPFNNYIDGVGQRILPIVYALAVICMLAKLSGIEDRLPSTALQVPESCVPKLPYAEYMVLPTAKGHGER